MLSSKAIDRLAMAHDASHYAFTPMQISRPQSVNDILDLFAHARREGSPLTFRAGGSSLSGQSAGDGILVDSRRGFRGIQILDEGRRVKVSPGETIRAVNARLARYGYKLGPDPASEIACTIGGMVANNSSGMQCGTTENSYATLDSLEFVLASGTRIDTADPDAARKFAEAEPELVAGLMRLRQRILDNPDSVNTIRRQFAMKNTMGYGINSLLDFETPLEIARHLMIGSEGTLGFVTSATFRTIPVAPHAASALAIFPTLREATAALPDLVAAGFAAIELMDAQSLRVAQTLPEATPEILELDVTGQAALLLELQDATTEGVGGKIEAVAPLLASLPLTSPTQATSHGPTRARLWHIRKGLYTTVAGHRNPGATALLEDIVVPVPTLLDTCTELIKLFGQHQYENSVIFGHAKDGNVHFMLNENFTDPVCMERYIHFTEDMVDLVIGHGGNLKAEHGTGRIMAPFVARQYGDELHQVMREIKRLFDPAGILNPGVVLTDDPQGYLKNLKLVPSVEDEVNRCVECGFCEPVCPSRELTLTPRQRIALRRELASNQLDEQLLKDLDKDYDYYAIQTCAVDGMCGEVCPLHINTGDLVRRLRAEQANRVLGGVWGAAAKAWGPFTKGASVAMTTAHAVAPVASGITKVARKIISPDVMPQYSKDLPKGGRRPKAREAEDPVAFYLPACIQTMFSSGVPKAFTTLCERAGVPVTTLNTGSLCCGTPWKSKGFLKGYETQLKRAEERLAGSPVPIVVDAASCTEGFHVMQSKSSSEEFKAVQIVDVVKFAHEWLLPHLTVTHRLGSIALHPTCSSTHLGLNDALKGLAEAIADEAYVPLDWGCCAFAGDRGMLHPELNASAAKREAAEINSRHFDAYASLNRTCEIGIGRATGKPYVHILELVEQATRP